MDLSVHDVLELHNLAATQDHHQTPMGRGCILLAVTGGNLAFSIFVQARASLLDPFYDVIQPLQAAGPLCLTKEAPTFLSVSTCGSHRQAVVSQRSKSPQLAKSKSRRAIIIIFCCLFKGDGKIFYSISVILSWNLGLPV